MTSRILKSAAPAVLAALLIAGCVPQSQPNPVQQMAAGLVGKPVSAAFQAFGQPGSALPPSEYGGGHYTWSATRISTGPGTAFVQTGTQYAGTKTTAELQPTPTGVAPVNVTRDQYEATGYYEQQKTVDYLCDILVMTNPQGIITVANVAGCS